MTNPLTITVPNVRRGALLVGSVTSSEPQIKRSTLWLFPPDVQPGDGETWKTIKRQRIWSYSLHPLGTFKKRTGALKPGTYSLVAHVPAEPGSAFGGLMQVATFTVTA